MQGDAEKAASKGDPPILVPQLNRYPSGCRLAQTQLERVPLRLAYDASQHGWSARAFHTRVDSFGPAVVVARTESGCVCGGYNPRGWISLGEDRDSIAAFLFTWQARPAHLLLIRSRRRREPAGGAAFFHARPEGDTSLRPIKLPKAGGPSLAVVQDNASTGPLFGPEGLHIPLQAPEPRAAKSRLGSYYERMPGGGRSLFPEGASRRGGSSTTVLTDLWVFVAEGDGEKWELGAMDIVWKSSKK